MHEHSPEDGPYLEVVFPGRPHQIVRIHQFPFLIGRGSETGNHFQIDDRRISRRCVAILAENSGYSVEDRGHRQGIFVNRRRVERSPLKDGDVIDFGLDDCCELIFRAGLPLVDVEAVLSRIGNFGTDGSTRPSGRLSKLNLLLEATSLLHSQLPLDSVLGTMLDHAIAITKADRGVLLEPDGEGLLLVRLGRNSGGENLPIDSLAPSQTALRMAMERRSSVITADLDQADMDLKSAQSIVAQRLRSVVVVPLYAMPRASSDESQVFKRGQLLGSLYLDSRRPAAFSNLDLQILDALGMEAASILDNARLVQQERERQRLEQELSIAREIQQALLPAGMHDFPHFAVAGLHRPCHEVGGDYFDVFPLNEERIAFVIADVSGKGLGAALLTTILQGALSGMTVDADPVKVFKQINKFICRHSALGRYATMFFAILGRDGKLEFVRAGHPSPMLIRRGAVSELYSGGSFPVGLVEEAEFTLTCIQLEPEDTLVLYSDGITEAEDIERNLFKSPRLVEALSGMQCVSVEEVQRTVLGAVEAFSRGATQSDDITLLVVRYRALTGDEPAASI